jgi:hypothetical protein
LSLTKHPEKELKGAEHRAQVEEAMKRATEQATKGPREAQAGRFDYKDKKAAE